MYVTVLDFILYGMDIYEFGQKKELAEMDNLISISITYLLGTRCVNCNYSVSK